MGCFAKQFRILFSETTEVPEAELESNFGHAGRVCTALLQRATDTVHPDTTEVSGRSHSHNVLEGAIKSSGRNLRCKKRSSALHSERSLRQSEAPRIAQRGFRAARRVDCRLNTAGCVIPASDLACSVSWSGIDCRAAPYSFAVLLDSRCY